MTDLEQLRDRIADMFIGTDSGGYDEADAIMPLIEAEIRQRTQPAIFFHDDHEECDNAIRNARAEAWDEGHREGIDYVKRGSLPSPHRDKHPNPYRDQPQDTA